VLTQRFRESFSFFHAKAEGREETRFAGAIAMRRIQQVIRDLFALDHGLLDVGQFHLAWRFSGTKVSARLNSNPHEPQVKYASRNAKMDSQQILLLHGQEHARTEGLNHGEPGGDGGE
jgi:hypothetical protein